MVENMGLFPWLGRVVSSSVSSVGWGSQKEGREMVQTAAMATEIIEVVLRVPSVQRRALGDGYTDLCHCTLLLHCLLANPSTPSPFLSTLRRPVLRILGITLEVSRHRHLGTYSCKLSAFELLQTVEWLRAEAFEDSANHSISFETQALCLQFFLKNGPPVAVQATSSAGQAADVASVEEEAAVLDLALWAIQLAMEVPKFGLWDPRLGLFHLSLSETSGLDETQSHEELVLKWVSATACSAAERETLATWDAKSSNAELLEPPPGRGGRKDAPYLVHSVRKLVGRRRLLARALLSLHSKLDIVARRRCLEPLVSALQRLDPDSELL